MSKLPEPGKSKKERKAEMSTTNGVLASGELPDEDGRDQTHTGSETVLDEETSVAAEGRALPTLSSDIAAYAMKRLRATQTELAERIRVTQGYISRVLNGHENFTIIYLERIARELDLPVAVLIWQASTLPEPEMEEERDVVRQIHQLMELAYPEHFPPAGDEGESRSTSQRGSRGPAGRSGCSGGGEKLRE